jgi:flagellin
MASDITLSKGVRSNLLSLQSTAELLGRTQERLSTGKKVNSALDNPINFFTSSGLSARANDLSRLLDSVGNGVQTINAADKGITAIKKLIESAQATARQALTAGEASTTYSLAQTGTIAVAADVAGVTSANNFGSLTLSAEASAQLSINTTNIASGTDGQTFSFTFDGTTYTFENDVGADGVAGANVGFDGTAGDLATVLNGLFGAAGSVFQGTVTSGVNSITVAAATGETEDFSGIVAGAGLTATETDNVVASTLTLNDGTNSDTFTYVGSGANAANGTFTSLNDLVSAINHANSAVSGNLTASASGTNLRLVGDNAAATITAGGTVGTGLGFTGTSTATNAAYNATVAAYTGQLTFQVGSGAVQTVEFGDGASGEVTTRAGLTARLAAISSTFTDASVSLNGSGQVALTSTSASNVTIGGAGASFVGLAQNTYAPTGTTTDNATRASLQSDFNNLLSQISTLAADSSYNGVNLLDGDDLSVIFNEDGSSSLSIEGVDFSAAGLGLTNATGSAFQTNAGVNSALAQLDTATANLRTQSSRFGSNLSIVQTRQDFTKNLINVLQSGADNLVLADTNEEGANMLALQTRQQLSSVALSMASQADQSVLRLF